jgi:hypothetical protein
MKKSVSFSKDDIESTSLNFTELRERGIEYVQELSGDVWTDYNSHDPGITILEQLSYALTDIGLRSSLPVEELLVKVNDESVDGEMNAFIAPSDIFSSHPVTIMDMRKMIIDHFTEIQNIWITTKNTKGGQEELRGIYQIEILPKLRFLNAVKLNAELQDSFLEELKQFLFENRNLGENFETPLLLKPQAIQIEIDIFLKENTDIETSIANLLIALFEYIYTPVQYQNIKEIEEEENRLEKIYSGPGLSNGFISSNLPDKRLKSIHIDELQKLFSKINGINKSTVRSIKHQGKNYNSLKADRDKFFHLLVEENSEGITDKRFESIFSNMNVFVNYKKIPSVNKQMINNLFFETWSKKHRGYSLSTSKDDYFKEKLKATYRNPGNYISIQKHFPLIYGIGSEGISEKESVERHARANQLKAYLMLFEQHLTNYLAQLANLNDFFNINYNPETSNNKTYFTQWLSSVPNIEKLADENNFPIESLEPESVFFNRKNKIYDHLLARFGEELSDIPWKIGLRMHVIKSQNEFNKKLIKQKSYFLSHLKDVGYERMKGESIQQDGDKKISRRPSGLEQIINIKTGIPNRKGESKSLVPRNLNRKFRWKTKEKSFTDINRTKYIPLPTDEFTFTKKQKENASLPGVTFGRIGLKTLFKETLDLSNYRIHIPASEKEKISVIFQKELGNWAQLFTCKNKHEVALNIQRIIDFFTEQNINSEGFYIVDHILLKDMLAESKFGFKFIDYDLENDSTEDDKYNLLQALEEKSWLGKETDRNKLFFNTRLEKENFCYDNGQWVIHHNGNKIFLAPPESSEWEKLNRKLIKETFCFTKGKWFIKLEDGQLIENIETDDLKKLNGIFEEEVYLKNHILPPKLNAALEKNAYSFNKDKWQIKFKNKILASCTIKEKKLADILKEGNYYFDQGEWHLKNGKTKTTETENNLKKLNAEFNTIYEKTKSIVQLFTLPEKETGRLRFQELETLRLKGVLKVKYGDYRQRRLVFQRKLWNDEILDEDFFDMKISVLLPDWPARFQDEQFKSYLKDIILERIPTHISNDILWVNIKQLKAFEKRYFRWRDLKTKQNNIGEVTEELKEAAFEVYKSIKEIKAKNKK